MSVFMVPDQFLWVRQGARGGGTDPKSLFGGTWEHCGTGKTTINVDENTARARIRQSNEILG